MHASRVCVLNIPFHFNTESPADRVKQTLEMLRMDDVTAGGLKAAIGSMPDDLIKTLMLAIAQHVDGNVSAETRDEHPSWFKGLLLISNKITVSSCF